MEFGLNLRRIRSEKGLTQSALAELLGVSDRAVSRWETGTAFPDVTLLAQLALALDTSTDALLGVDPIRMQADILRATEECTRLLNQDDAPAAVAMLRKISTTYPNQPELMVYLARALQRTGTEDAAREALSLCRAADGGSPAGNGSPVGNVSPAGCRPMRLSTTFGCKQVMALALKRLGRREEAARLVEDEMPAIWVSRELLLPQVAPQERAERIRRSNVTMLTTLLTNTLERLSRDTGDSAYSQVAGRIRSEIDAMM